MTSKGGKGADANSSCHISSEGENCCDAADKMLRVSTVVLQCRVYHVMATPSGWPALVRGGGES